jgi:mono/diheme cytochrome c family protein
MKMLFFSVRRLAAGLLIVITFSACHSVRRGEPITGPMNLTPKQAHGRIVFQQRCHQCHPNGEAGLGPALNNKPAPVFLMKTQVRFGLGAMPRFDNHAISHNDLDDLIAYVIALRKADREESKTDPAKTSRETK